PESWSTSLKVLRSRSWPVPVSNESRYSSMGGITSSYPCEKNRSRIRRRSRSTRAASAGRMSSMCSGSSHFCMIVCKQAIARRVRRPANFQSGYGGLFRQEKQQQAGQHRRQADKPDLPVGHFGEPAKRIPPDGREQKRQHAFDDQHQRDRRQQHARMAFHPPLSGLDSAQSAETSTFRVSRPATC